MTSHLLAIDTPLGRLALTAHDTALVSALYDTDDTDLPTETAHPVLLAARAQFEAFFAGRLRDFDLPVDPAGTPFQKAVWTALRTLPHGATSTYRDIAARVDRPQAVRAVGTAIGRNPLLVIVPCHRVLGADGALRGFAAGLHRKAALLRLEGRADTRWRDLPEGVFA